MSNNILDWDKLSMKQRAAYIRLGVANGYSDIDSIKLVYNEYLKGGSLKESLEEPSMEELVSRVNNSKADFVQRLKDPNRATIQDWEYPKRLATHKMGVGTDADNNVYIYPEVLNINGELTDFTRPPFAPWVGLAAAEERGDTVRVPNIDTGIRFSKNYKGYYSGFDKYALGGPLITEVNKYSGEENHSQQMERKETALGKLKIDPKNMTYPEDGNSGYLLDPKITAMSEEAYKQFMESLSPDERAIIEESEEWNPELYPMSERDYYISRLQPILNQYSDEEGKEFGNQVNHYLNYNIPSGDSITINQPEIFRGTKLNVNLLDSLAYNAGKYNTVNKDTIPLSAVFGLPARETTYGKYYKGAQPFIIDFGFFRPNGVYTLGIPRNNPLNILNLESLLNDLPYNSTRQEQRRNEDKGKSTLGIPGLLKAARRAAKKYNYDINPYFDAFGRFLSKKYNPGDPEYNSTVLNEGASIISDPAFIEWFNKSGQQLYNKGKQEVTKSLGGPLVQTANKFAGGGFTTFDDQQTVDDNVTPFWLNPDGTLKQIQLTPEEQNTIDTALEMKRVEEAEKEQEKFELMRNPALNPNASGRAESWDAGNAAMALPFLGAAALGNGAVSSTVAGVNKVLTNPYVDAVLTADMANNARKDIISGNVTPITALNLAPSLRLAKPAYDISKAIGTRTYGVARNLTPQNLRNHLYVSRPPIGYDGIKESAKRFISGILSGKKADIENPFWFNADNAKQLQSYAYVPDFLSQSQKKEYLEQFGKHALEARADAWRMHNLIPQKYNTFIENPRQPGFYTDVKGIENLKFLPYQSETPTIDFVNSAGGNVGVPIITDLGKGIPNAGAIDQSYGVTTIFDDWDLHPFSRQGDRLTERLRPYWLNMTKPIHKLAKKIDELAFPLRYDIKEINDYVSKQKSNPFYDGVDIDMFPVVGIKRNIGDRMLDLANNLNEFHYNGINMLKPIEKKLINLEVGKITGGRPFHIRYDIPWTKQINLDFKHPLTVTKGFNSENFLPNSVTDWKRNAYYTDILRKFDGKISLETPIRHIARKRFAGGGSTQKQTFLDTLELALVENAYYDTPLWRQFLTDLAERESSYRPNITNSIGAKGYFQLMPSNRSEVWTTPTLLFSEMFRLTDSNLKYINTHMTDLDWERAKQLGIDIYGLVAGAHLGGAKNALKALRGTSNAKDMNNTSIMDYMIRFSLSPKSPSKTRHDDTPQTFPIILTYQSMYPKSEVVFPLETILDLGQNVLDILAAYPQIDNNASYQSNPFESLGPSLDMWDIMEELSQNTPIQPIYEPKQSPSVYELLERMGYQDSLNSLLDLLEALNYIRNKK